MPGSNRRGGRSGKCLLGDGLLPKRMAMTPIKQRIVPAIPAFKPKPQVKKNTVAKVIPKKQPQIKQKPKPKPKNGGQKMTEEEKKKGYLAQLGKAFEMFNEETDADREARAQERERLANERDEEREKRAKEKEKELNELMEKIKKDAKDQLLSLDETIKAEPLQVKKHCLAEIKRVNDALNTHSTAVNKDRISIKAELGMSSEKFTADSAKPIPATKIAKLESSLEDHLERHGKSREAWEEKKPAGGE